MNRVRLLIVVLLLGLVSVILIRALTGKKERISTISISYPFNNALFPPEFPAPAFEWIGKLLDSANWEVSLVARNKRFKIHDITRDNRWTPDEVQWDSLKSLSRFRRILFTVRKSGDYKDYSEVGFKISRDTVGAPVLYRQIPLPSVFAEKNLDSMSYLLINFGSKNPPHAVMKGFPVCGNCHSFTADGKTIGLDLDAGRRDKGGYFITDIRDTILFSLDNYRSWSRIQKRSTFGLFSKISPDGRYVVTTIRDRVVFYNYPVNSYENIIYSQLFFPVNGHLGIYDRQTGELAELPGANLDEYVQSNAFWTPDGQYIFFSRADALPRDTGVQEITVRDEKLINEFIARKKDFKFNIYKIPFNNGKGGKAEPIRGASHNGMSNYFPAVSPDGKWLIFCQAENYMLLMPDSRLYILPVGGGEPRKLACNFNSMNSWHAWSPNSKWLVFASKGLSPYTDMFLTHIDRRGNASIPVLVDKARQKYRVINYPEFVNRDPEAIIDMNYEYVELAHIRSALRQRNTAKAIELFHQLESQDPFFFSEDCIELSIMLNNMGLPEESDKYEELAKNSLNASAFFEQH